MTSSDSADSPLRISKSLLVLALLSEESGVKMKSKGRSADLLLFLSVIFINYLFKNRFLILSRNWYKTSTK